MVTAAIALARSAGLTLCLNLIVASRPGSREEPNTDIVRRPADAAVGATLLLTVAARGLVGLQIKGASGTGNAREEGCAGRPDHGVLGVRDEVGSLRKGRSTVTGDGGQQSLHVIGHVGISLVELSRVGRLGQHPGLVLIGGPRLWVQSGEPRLGVGVVVGEVDVDVEGAQISLGVREIVGSNVRDDKTSGILGSSRQSSAARDLRKAEEKAGHDGGSEHLDQELSVLDLCLRIEDESVLGW